LDWLTFELNKKFLCEAFLLPFQGIKELVHGFI